MFFGIYIFLGVGRGATASERASLELLNVEECPSSFLLLRTKKKAEMRRLEVTSGPIAVTATCSYMLVAAYGGGYATPRSNLTLSDALALFSLSPSLFNHHSILISSFWLLCCNCNVKYLFMYFMFINFYCLQS